MSAKKLTASSSSSFHPSSPITPRRNVHIETPGKSPIAEEKEEGFKFSPPLGQRILALLRQAAEQEPINLVLSDFSFQFVYNLCCKKLTVQKPSTAQYLSMMETNDLKDIAELVMWIVLYDTIPRQCLQNDVILTQKRLYDRLSLLFYELRKRLTSVSSVTNQNLIDEWTIAVAATILQLTFTEYQGSEVDNNYEFVMHVENNVRFLFVGFPPANLMAFHSVVYHLVSLKAQKTIPKKLSPTANMTLFVSGKQEKDELMGAMSIEGHFEEVAKKSKDIVFTTNTRTGLMDNALKLTGNKGPVEAKGRSFRKGTTEVSDIVMKKCNAIICASQEMVQQHADERDMRLFKICDDEKICKTKLKKAHLKPLNITFETFGYNPMYGRLVLGGLPSNITGEARSSWRAATKVVPKKKPERTTDEIIATINKCHPVILETGIA